MYSRDADESMGLFNRYLRCHTQRETRIVDVEESKSLDACTHAAREESRHFQTVSAGVALTLSFSSYLSRSYPSERLHIFARLKSVFLSWSSPLERCQQRQDKCSQRGKKNGWISNAPTKERQEKGNALTV